MTERDKGQTAIEQWMREAIPTPYEDAEPFNALRDLRAVVLAQEAEIKRLRKEFEAMTDLHDAKHRDWQASEAEVLRLRKALRLAQEKCDA